MDIAAYLENRRTLVDGELARIMALPSGIADTLAESMRYSVLAGGKRIRPILALASCETVGGETRRVLPAACALELAHAFTLIHDDLPCMDNDDFRRGKPTNHKVFGEAQALLAGCSLLALAFRIVAEQAGSDGAAAERAIRACRILADAVGWEGVMGGQSLDIIATRKGANLEGVKSLCRLKTASLIAASVAVGAIMGGGREEQVLALESFGSAIGLAFQVADDILNVEGDAAVLGKGAGTDARAGKTTFPSLLGVQGAKDYARGLLNEALESLRPMGGEAGPLRALARYIVERDR